MVIYVVEKGDTLYDISRRYGLDVNEVIRINEFTQPDSLVVGQTVVLPIDSYTYEVRAGDTLYSIARRNGISLDSLMNANPDITNPRRLQIGQKINIPIGITRLGSMEANGYVLPNISMETLNKTLPHLTYTSIFSYDADRNGNLKAISDDAIIEASLRNGVEPFMVITNYEEGTGFSSDIAREIFTNPAVSSRLISETIRIMQQKGYKGLNVDFEYIYPDDRDNYTNFLRAMKTALTPLGYPMFVAVAPKISADQPGLLYEAHDYKSIGEIADRVIIMTYEWGYLYGEPQAVSPIKPIRKVLEYAITEITADKILMGVSNYGYDWTLPYQRGTAAEILSNVGAVDRARRVGANIQFDENAQAPYFTYQTPTNQHIVWFEDARSIASRLMLVDEYGLAGVSYWTINQFFPQNWLVQDALFEIR